MLCAPRRQIGQSSPGSTDQNLVQTFRPLSAHLCSADCFRSVACVSCTRLPVQRLFQSAL